MIDWKAVLTKILITTKNAVRFIAFCLVVILLIGIWSSWFKPKNYDGTLSMRTFYEQPENSIDLLCIGSSHSFIDINTGVLWDEFGVPSYVLGASLQPFWNTYYSLKEALKTQTPRLVVLEALAVQIEDDYSDHGVLINNTAGMHWNMNKFESIRASVTDTDGFIDYSLLFEEYHSRYSELNMFDIDADLSDAVKNENFKGFYDYLRTEYQSKPFFQVNVDPIPMTNKQEYYYRLIIEYCRDNDIPLCIVVSPDAGYTEEVRSRYIYAAQIAEEYGVEFIDFNEYYDRIGLDFDTDFGDIGHLNYLGNRKYTSYLGAYLCEHYDLIDRSDDTTGIYDSWEENARYLETRARNYELQETSVAEDYVDILNSLSDDYEVIVMVSDNTHISDELARYLGINGIPFIRMYDDRRYLIRDGITYPLEADENGLYFEEYLGSHHFVVCSDGIYYDGWSTVNENHDGVVIAVIDTYNQLLVDCGTVNYNEVWK